jgi:hypothetical protein
MIEDELIYEQTNCPECFLRANPLERESRGKKGHFSAK